MYFWESMYWSILYSRSGSNPTINRNKIWGGQNGGVLVYNGGEVLSFYVFCRPNDTPVSWLLSCIRSRWEGYKTPMLSLCQGIFTDSSIFSVRFLYAKERQFLFSDTAASIIFLWLAMALPRESPSREFRSKNKSFVCEITVTGI